MLSIIQGDGNWCFFIEACGAFDLLFLEKHQRISIIGANFGGCKVATVLPSFLSRNRHFLVCFAFYSVFHWYTACAQQRVRAKQEMQISGVDAADRAPEEAIWKDVAKNLRNTKTIYFYGLFQMFLISFISFCFLLNWDKKLKPGKSDHSGKQKPKYWREKKGPSVQSSSAFCMSPIVGVTVENV